jgi:hypothetical protein
MSASREHSWATGSTVPRPRNSWPFLTGERLTGKRDHAILARPLGCGRQQLAHLKVEDIVERERAAIVDLVGKGKARADRGPYWVKQGVGQWTCGAGIT